LTLGFQLLITMNVAWALLILLRPPMLRIWHETVRKIPSHKILPLALGGEREQSLAALLGDKLLGVAVVKVLIFEKHVVDPGTATLLTDRAVSNDFLATHMSSILPDLCEKYDDLSEHLSDREKGTMVEAAVARVHEIEDHDDGYAAILNLASWLVEEAGNSPILNTKGYLLNLGGEVKAVRVGGSSHEPIFEAFATYEGESCQAQAKSKRKSEQLAAELLLRKMGALADSEVWWEQYNDIIAIDAVDSANEGEDHPN
jgi:Double-stranded RNA binding motif